VSLATAEQWRERLSAALAAHGVPGGSLSIYDGAETLECAAGILNVRTGLAATTDSLFLVGSITKPFTATLVLGLVQDGKLDLDDRVLDVLPELRFASGIDPAPMTISHLLTHSCGIESDNFADFGRGDDALRRFVASMAEFELVHEPGSRFSYSNSGYSILGRIVEAITGQSYAQALRERVLDPLGLERATTFAEEAILYPAAIGHYPGPDGVEPASVWTTSRACEPEGMICAPSGEILRLGLDHLHAYRGGSSGLLAPATARLVHERAVAVPPVALPQTHQGLGWATFASRGGHVVGHDGSITGQAGVLRVDLERGTGVALLTNCDPALALAIYRDLLDAGLDELIGEAPQKPTPPATALSPEEAERLPGTYRRLNRTLRIARDGDRLLLTVEDEGGLLAEHNNENRIHDRPLIPLGHGLFVVEGTERFSPERTLAMTTPERGTDYIYYRGRVARRVAAA
jgi:CubicO group peptidase (beta-lactamase class C family)